MLKKSLSLIIVFLIVLSFASCSADNVNHNFTVDDVTDSSPSQQKWLMKPDSLIVINPDAINSDSFENVDGKLAMNIGVTDGNGKVVKTLTDVLFCLEPTYTNGKGGEEVWSCEWDNPENVLFVKRTDPLATATYHYLDATFDVSTWADTEEFDANGNLVAYASHDGPVAEFQLTFTSHYFFMPNFGVPYNSDLSYYLVIDCEISDKEGNYPKVWGVRGYYDHKVTEVNANYLADTGDFVKLISNVSHIPGFYCIKINDMARDFRNKKGNLVYPTLFLEREGHFKFNQFSIRAIDDEECYGNKETTYHRWSPYSMIAETQYPNGTVARTTDIISGKNAVSRQIEGVCAGVIDYAGYLNGGKPTYEKATSASSYLTVKGEDFEYALFFNYLGSVTYYDSEEDMMNRTNGSSEPKDSSMFWLLELSKLEQESATNIGFAVSLKGEDVKAAAKKVGLRNFYKTLEEDMRTYWNEFIAKNDASPYISRMPEKQ